MDASLLMQKIAQATGFLSVAIFAALVVVMGRYSAVSIHLAIKRATLLILQLLNRLLHHNWQVA